MCHQLEIITEINVNFARFHNACVKFHALMALIEFFLLTTRMNIQFMNIESL